LDILEPVFIIKAVKNYIGIHHNQQEWLDFLDLPKWGPSVG